MYQNKLNKTSTTHSQANTAAVHDQILLGLDLHSAHIRVVRQIDGTRPQPAQRLTWDKIIDFAKKQTLLGKKVCAVYEAGAFGFGLSRQLSQIGVSCYVIHPVKLDPRCRRVQTDKTDAQELALMLGRYLQGNTKAMAVVQVPTEQQEQQRIQVRHRRYLKKEVLSLQAHGRGVLLCQGFRSVGSWWQDAIWEKLSPKMPAQVQQSLQDCRELIAQYQQRLKPLEQTLTQQAPEKLPVGMGALSYVLLQREIFNWHRFNNRRQVAGFLGLGGGVLSSGPSHYDLSITKAGSPYLRTLLVELAWRMVRFQPNYTAVKKWQHILNRSAAHRRHRKRAIVALSRQLAVDLWKWHTGKITAAELGWV
jgi:transposase